MAGEGAPITVNDPALSRAALPALKRVDFNLGVRNEAKGITAMIHTEDFDLDEAVLPLGVRGLAEALWDQLSGGGEGR